MSQKSYPIGSPEDFIINSLPSIVTGLQKFLDVTQSFLRDFQLDLQLVAAGTADTTRMAEELQTKVRELQQEVINSVDATNIFKYMVDELKTHL